MMKLLGKQSQFFVEEEKLYREIQEFSELDTKTKEQDCIDWKNDVQESNRSRNRFHNWININ